MSFKSLKSGLGIALRNTKASLFSEAAIDRIKGLQERWEGSVDAKEATYANLVSEMDKQGIRLPTEEEMKADLSLSVDYVQKSVVVSKFSAVLNIAVESTKNMSASTAKFITDKFLNSERTDLLVDSFANEVADTVTVEMGKSVDAKIRGKKYIPPKPKINHSKEKVDKLVPPKITKKINEFVRAKPSDRLNLKAQLNAILKFHVVNNMGSPALNHWDVGRGHDGTPFAQSAEVLQVAPRTIFYTYNTRPYSVFDPKVSKYHGLSNKYRNPRAIISAALRDALLALKVGQKYTMRQDHINGN